jgi:hypothetical protein
MARPDHNTLCLFDGARSRRRCRGGKAGERGRARCRGNQEACAAGDGDPTQHGAEDAPAVEFGHGFTLLDLGLEFGVTQARGGAGRARATPAGCAQGDRVLYMHENPECRGLSSTGVGVGPCAIELAGSCAAKAHPYERRRLPQPLSRAGPGRGCHGRRDMGGAPVRGVKRSGATQGGPPRAGRGLAAADGTTANTAQNAGRAKSVLALKLRTTWAPKPIVLSCFVILALFHLFRASSVTHGAGQRFPLTSLGLILCGS